VISPIRLLVSLAIVAAAGSVQSETAPSPYAGQQARDIKSLSDSDIKGLLEGSGAGYAKAAELNAYPGPAHVLELSTQLHLDVSQEAATRELLAAHKARARSLGAELVRAEREPDEIFSNRHADSAAVDRATQRIGLLQAQLRAEHLKTHLSQTALLSADQIRDYAVLRGYAPAARGAAPGDAAPPLTITNENPFHELPSIHPDLRRSVERLRGRCPWR